MKLLKKVLVANCIVLTLLTMPIVSTNLNITSTVQAASSIKINKKKKTLRVGDKYTLKIKGTSKKVKWTSSNKKVATVNSKGKVKAKKKGTATITAKVGGKKYKCKITVKKASVLKVGNHTLKYGKYRWHYTYGKQEEDMTYTINKDGTFSYIRKWSNYQGEKFTDTGSGKYKVYYSKGDDYDSTSCWVIRFNFKNLQTYSNHVQLLKKVRIEYKDGNISELTNF